MFSALVGLLPFLASAQAYFILSHNILETTRLDPIVNPGTVSSHVHSIVGGSNFDKTLSFESARAGSCTTAPVSEDKSSYWTPQLYYYNPADQSYQAIPVAGVNTYYLPRTGADGKVRAFPDGLRMISGSPNRRTFNNDADSKAATFVCLDYSGGHQGDPEWDERNSFFNHNCPQGMRAQIFFRSCWDGVNLDSADHVSHMAWPSGGVDGGECPASHPVRLVSLFYEFIYNVQNFPFNDAQYPTWVFANGDTTGYGMHGDFVNGWPAYNNGTNILQQAIDGCNDDNGVGGELQNCDPFVPYLNYGGCSPQNAQVAEDIGMGHSIASLPGNNPIWIGNGTKPSYANYTEGNTTYTDFKSTIPTGYTEVGCIAEGSNGRALAAKSWSSDGMTRGACVSFCQSNGFPLAGIEYGRECYCDTQMKNGASNATLLDSGKCGSKCANNTNEYCGGASTLSLFNNPAMYPIKQLPVGWKANGCYTEGSGSRALKDYSFTSNSMTNELCMSTCLSKGYKIAGMEWNVECYCSNSFAAGSVLAKDSDCSAACAGDATELCGGSQRLTTFVYSNSTITAPTNGTSSSVSASASASAAKSNSTSIIASSSVAANSSTVASSSTSKASSVVVSSSTVSPSATVSPVASSSSISSSVVSSSANSSSISSTVASSAATSKAALVVVSSSSSSAALSSSAAVSSTVASSSTSSSASSAAASPSATGWQSAGCYSEGNGGRALSGYSFKAGNMTIGYCTSTCQSQGWKYAGIEYSSECYCGDTFNYGSALVSSGDCSMRCSGDNTQQCGGSYRLSVFSNPSVTVQNVLPSGWTETGCYTEISGRALKGYSFTSNSMTPSLCASTCGSRGFKLAGSEYSGECYCGNQVESGSTVADSSQCANTCKGDIHQICGGSSRLSLYTFGSSSAQANAKVAIVASSSTAASSSSSSVAASTSSAAAAASSSSVVTSKSTSTVTSSTSTVTSSTSTSTIKSSTSSAVPTSTSTSSATPSPSSSASPSPSPVASTTAAQVAPSAVPSSGYVGCLQDRGNPRSLNGTQVSSNAMTNEVCVAHCKRLGFAFAGTQYSRECYCGNYFNLSWQTSDSTCSMKCNGDNSQFCGGNYLLTTYATGNGNQTVYGTKPTRRQLRRGRSTRIVFN